MKQLLPFVLTLLLATCGPMQAQTPPVITPAQAQQQLARSGVVLLDVRTPAEFATGHLRGAHNVNFFSTDFPDQVAKLDPNASYVLYCKSGNRADKAGTLMMQNGFKNVVNAGGFEALKAGGLPTE